MPHSYRFGQVEVRPVERQVLIEGRPVSLGSRAFDVLMALIRNRDRVVSKNELLDIVWPGLVVEENNLQAQVSALRKLLGPRAFATIPGFGYRFAMALEDDAAAPSSAPPSSAPLTNLPNAATALIGRDPDLQAVTKLVCEHRLVTILGAGGIGKTRLAQSVAHGLTTRHAHGVWWVDLAAISSADKIAPAIASAASVQLGDGDAVALLARALADREILLVLDNCEHLAKAVALVASAALRMAPALHILSTSQEVLQAPGERVYRLDSLAVPPSGTALEAARSFGAVRLLEERAQAADRRFALGEETIAGAIELCRHLDGIALAIEMAAARLPLLGVEALNARLGERLRMLRSADRGAPEHHRTLRGTLDWSHSLLTEHEQAALRRLAVFCGSFRLEIAQQVAAGEGLDEWSVLDSLMALVDKSLVQIEPSHSPRYRLLESTRLYALERLSEHGEMDVVLRRHGEAMADLGKELAHYYLSPNEPPSIASYTPDYEDLHAAFERAAESRDAEVAALTIRALTILDFERNVNSNIRRRKETAVALLDVASPLAKGHLLNALSFFRLIPVPGHTRLSVAEERVAAWRPLGDRFQLYIALAYLGADRAASGNIEASDTALAEARALEDPRWAAHLRWFYAFAAKNASLYHDDPDAYTSRSRAMLQVAMETKSRARIAEARVCCGQAALLSGNVEEAIRLTLASISELRELGQPVNLIDALTNLSAAYAIAGDLDSARAPALAAIRSPWQRESAGFLFDQIGRLAARLGLHSQASLILGFADRGYAMAQDARHTLAARAEREATALIEAAVGSLEHSRLRALGADLNEGQAEALAKEVLEAP